MYNWREGIYNAFYTGSSVQNILERALDITDNPVTVMFSQSYSASDIFSLRDAGNGCIYSGHVPSHS